MPTADYCPQCVETYWTEHGWNGTLLIQHNAAIEVGPLFPNVLKLKAVTSGDKTVYGEFNPATRTLTSFFFVQSEERVPLYPYCLTPWAHWYNWPREFQRQIGQ